MPVATELIKSLIGLPFISENLYPINFENDGLIELTFPSGSSHITILEIVSIIFLYWYWLFTSSSFGI